MGRVDEQTSTMNDNFNELYRHVKDGERRTLNVLNSRFEIYLKQLKELPERNKTLQEQIEHLSNQRSSISLTEQFRELSEQINEQVRKNLKIEIRSQRAEYDRKSFGNHLKIALLDDEERKESIRRVEHELESKVHELTQWEKHYESRKEDLQMAKDQYDQSMKNLMVCRDHYDQIVAERMQIDQKILNLQNELLLERTCHRRRHEDFQWIEKIGTDLNLRFDQTEYDQIVQKIREDYRKFHQMQLEELEISYQNKFEMLQEKFERQLEDMQELEDEEEQLLQENQLLEEKLHQLERNHSQLTEQQQSELVRLNDEFDQLNAMFPDVESLIMIQRQSTVHLWTEIHTYRSLLINLSSLTEARWESSSYSLEATIHQIEDRTGFKVHHNAGMVWVRI